MDIKKVCSTANTTVKKGRKIEWIFLHYTATTNSKDGRAKAIANMFSKSSTQASADFIVDDKNIVQYNGDIGNRYCWAVGGSKYSSMSTSQGGKYYNKACNANSISVEICSSKKSTKTLNSTDTDWYFTGETLDQAVKLVKYLMKKYDIDTDHVIMHHHRTGKICPNPWCVNEKSLAGYKNFIDRLGGSKSNSEKSTEKLTVAKPTLKKGYKSTQVACMQKCLNKIMGTNIATDGIFGSNTEATLRKFQKKYGLAVDGVYGNMSASKMRVLL